MNLAAESAFDAAVEAKVAERVGAVIEKWASTAQTLRKSAVGMLPAKQLATYHEAALLEGHGKALKSALTAPAEGPKGGSKKQIAALKSQMELAVAEARLKEAKIHWYACKVVNKDCPRCQRITELTAERDRIAEGKGGTHGTD